jgi:protein-tyrosine-phosphatase
MCEGYFRKLCQEAGLKDVEVSSAGVFAGAGEKASKAAASAMKRCGVDLSAHASKPLALADVEAADLIVAMSSGHRCQIGRLAPKALARTKLLLEFADRREADVADPFGGSPEQYSACFEEMKPALENLLLEVIRRRGQGGVKA